MADQTERHVDAVLAALDILECFRDQDKLNLKQLAELTGFTKNRILRLAGTLSSREYILRDPDSGIFSLGPKLLILGKAFERSLDLVQLARPLLRRLTGETGESASLYVRDGLKRIVLARVEGTRNIRYAVSEGQRMVLYAGASGKAILAFSPPEITEQALAAGRLEAMTHNTPTDPEKLKSELEQIKKRGFATSQAERDPDTASIAAPVFDHKGKLAGALSIAGPVSRMSNEFMAIQAQKVKTAADRLSELLGDVN